MSSQPDKSTVTGTVEPEPDEPSDIGDVVAGIFGLLLIAAAALAFCKRVKFPFTITLVLIGIGIAALVEHAGISFLAPLVAIKSGGSLPIAEIILFVFLPALIFESAFALDARQLRQNLIPILALAIPGLLISTFIIAGVVAAFTSIPFRYALVLGSILSATDPVAVIALFKKLGAPKRLTVLVEGESLFNDATAIVASRILVGVALAGTLTPASAVEGVGGFVVIFLGGILVGLVMAWLCGLILGKVSGDRFIEISLTTVLAYGSFIIAERFLHVSGVMATVAAAVTMGAWGRTKITPSVVDYLHNFWEFLAYVANCLIFLLVGLVVEFDQFGNAWVPLIWVIVGMLISRAAVVFGLVPVLGKISAPVNIRYQAVMYWGGLRGAIALAIVLQLPIMAEHFNTGGDLTEFNYYAQGFIPLVIGAVLFTLLVPGLTIERLVRKLQLDKPPLSERLARISGLLSGKRRAAERIPELQTGGLFSMRVAGAKSQECADGIRMLQEELEMLRDQEMDHDEERRCAFLQAFAGEKTAYYDMYAKGHLSEHAYRELSHVISQKAEIVGFEGSVPAKDFEIASASLLSQWMLKLADTLLPFTPIAGNLRASRTALDYEIHWGRQQGTVTVLSELDDFGEAQSIDAKIIDDVREHYRAWHDSACRQIDTMAEQFPEFVASMQERLADRMVLHAASEAIEEADRAGTIPHGVAEHMQEEFAQEIRQLRRVSLDQLHVNAVELLQTVPFFKDTPPDEFHRVAALLKEQAMPAGETIIKQGDHGDSLFLIARGVVRISREDDGQSRDLATLFAGDVFGEMALLHSEPRVATCRAVTPCSLFELRRADLDEIEAACPQMKKALAEAARIRRNELAKDKDAAPDDE